MRNSILEIGETIRERRELLGLLQPQLSEIAGVSTRTIQLVEQGKGNPSLQTLIKLIHPLGLSITIEIRDTAQNKK